MDTILDLLDRAVADHGHRPALIIKPGFRTRIWTYADIGDQVPRVAQVLRGAGVEPGDRVLIWAVNRPEWGIAFLGAGSRTRWPHVESSRLDGYMQSMADAGLAEEATHTESELTLPAGYDAAVELLSDARTRPTAIVAACDEVAIGAIDVKPGFQTYTLALPADAVERAARRDEPTRLRLLSTVWNPRQILGAADDRDLGVMIDRIEVR